MSCRAAVVCLLACLGSLSGCNHTCKFPEFKVAPCPPDRNCVWPGCPPDTACEWYGRWSGVQCEARPTCLSDLVEDAQAAGMTVLNAGEMGCGFFKGCGSGYPPFIAVLLLPQDVPQAEQLGLFIGADGCCGGWWVSSGDDWVSECTVFIDGGMSGDAGTAAWGG